MAVSLEEFRKVSICEVAKEILDILQTTHEGTQVVKNSKLQMLTTRFEEIRMREDEMFDTFYASFNDIVNSSFNLGERIPEPKIVRKILRSLPGRFRAKISAIEESKDINSIKVEQLVGSFQTYELTLDKSVTDKSLALKSVRNTRMESSDSDSPDDEELAYLANKFRKIFRKKKNPQKRYKGGPSESMRNSKYVRCHNCRGFGHVKSECPSNRRNLDKAMNTTLTNDESSSDNQSEKSTCDESEKYIAFTARIRNESDQGSEK
ncbi:unnamed protein product [Fraxinus pennsylvanica]|uniref:CCHC-type domain-containing protein n=1 Tax=Fraxinus pennsylvanica TaxID=56036 RepID=A0AAD2DJZ0_9LAMI|nr:unnamed protein product [Fraxinus pennsylvanica]